MEPDFEAMRKELTLNMIQMKENIQPVFEAADGIRADQASKGWSPAMSERIAGEWLIMMIHKMGEL